jgi:predicted DNA-binding transcriptional regulator AlpA
MIATNRHGRRREEALRQRSYTEEQIRELPDTMGGDPLLDARGTRQYCGDISEMTMWRWARDYAFPGPDIVIARRRFWRRSTLDAWLRTMQGKAA